MEVAERGVGNARDERDRSALAGLWDYLAGQSVLDSARCLVIIVTLLCVLVTLQPFPDLRDAELYNTTTGHLAVTYLCFAGLAAAALLLSINEHGPAFRSLATPLHLCFGGWMMINVLFSESPGVSLQRFALTVSVTALAITLPLLAPTQRSFNHCLGAAALILLGLCYFGVELMPQFAIHSAVDTIEPALAGDWRGTFGHKNIASPVMTILIYLGLYLTVAEATIAGPAIMALSGLFLVFTGGKTSAGLCLVILALASIVGAVRNVWLSRLLCFGPLAVLNMLTVGSVMTPVLGNITRMLPIDPKFTGRADVWEFALDVVREKPIFGHGFAAFWDNVGDRQAAAGTEWAVTAAHSHNSYLDLAVTIGVPGMVLAILIFVFKPLQNFHAIQADGRNLPMARFFLTVWLFGLYYGGTETFLLDRQNPVWFMFALSVAGMHFLARFAVREDAASDLAPNPATTA